MKGRQIDKARDLIDRHRDLHPVDLGELILRATTEEGSNHCLLIPRIATVDVRSPGVPMNLTTPEGTVGQPGLALPSNKPGWGKKIVRAARDPRAATWGVVSGDYNEPADRLLKGGAGVTNANDGNVSSSGGWWYRDGRLQPNAHSVLWEFIRDRTNRHEIIGGFDVVAVDPDDIHEMPEGTNDHGQHVYLEKPVETFARYDVRAGHLAEMVQGTDSQPGMGVWLIDPDGGLFTPSAR